MENAKIILENGVETNVNGIFYVFNSKYYFMYTLGEYVDDDYIQLYVVQVCKEIQNTTNGPIETGYMVGMETPNPDEWSIVQESITKIVDDKKNGTKSNEIQYLTINMLTNLKIVSKNKFKLMSHLLKDIFELDLPSDTADNKDSNIIQDTTQKLDHESVIPVNPLSSTNISSSSTQEQSDVIIDYRTRFFEEQEKNNELLEQIKNLEEKLNEVKNILG